MSDEQLRAIARELHAISDDEYGGEHPFARHYRARVRQTLAVVSALIKDSEPTEKSEE